MLKRSLMKMSVEVYRSLPISLAMKQKLKAAIMKPILGWGPREFQFPWRGMTVWIDREQSLDLRLFATGDYEPETLAVLERLAQPHGTAIDIGSNIGLISMWLSQCVGESGKVFAVEPSRWACDRALRNLKLSEIDNVEVIHAAASDRIGTAEIQVIDGYRVDNTDTSRLERSCLSPLTISLKNIRLMNFQS